MADNLTRRRHDTLMTTMAEKVGADLDEAEARGVLSPETRDEMLSVCTGCTDPIGCAAWLEGAPDAAAPPDYCRNRETLIELAKL